MPSSGMKMRSPVCGTHLISPKGAFAPSPSWPHQTAQDSFHLLFSKPLHGPLISTRTQLVRRTVYYSRCHRPSVYFEKKRKIADFYEISHSAQGGDDLLLTSFTRLVGVLERAPLGGSPVPSTWRTNGAARNVLRSGSSAGKDSASFRIVARLSSR